MRESGCGAVVMGAVQRPPQIPQTESIIVLFCQAEDGIRDLTVTGVQTCALPIWYRLRATIRKQCKLRQDWCATPASIRWRSASWLIRDASSAVRQDMARTWPRLNSSRNFRWRHDSSYGLVTARGACDSTRTFGRAMVLRVFLYTACRLLCVASAARPDGHRWW